MAAANTDFQVQPLSIVGPFNRQRFRQFGPEDTAGWYISKGDDTKKQFALYPQLGRAHVSYLGINRFKFGFEPRGIFKTINYFYVIEGSTVYRYDTLYNQVNLGEISSSAGSVYFTFLVVNSIVYACMVDSQFIYIYQENNTGGYGFVQVTDTNAPGIFTINGSVTKPGYIAAFGNRLTVSVKESSQFVLSAINLAGTGATNPTGLSFDPAKCFTNATGQVFAQEDGIIRQMGVLNNTLYIFTDYVTGIWANIAAVFAVTGVTFPWKKNTTFNWNFGMANSNSLDIDFGRMVWLARNSDGLLQYMVSQGGQPERISTKAIDTLLQRYSNLYGINNPFLVSNSNGFLYEYENTIFYRMSGGNYYGDGILDQEMRGNSIEFSFEANEWHRCIELNGERNRVQNHVYFNFMHLVTVTGDSTIYNMSGQYYYNEITNTAEMDPQADDAYMKYPLRYERITPLIFEDDYSEFEDEFVQIDFVWGDSNINYSDAPFLNAQFLIAEQPLDGQPQYIIAEQADSDGQPVFILAQEGNTPGLSDLTYNYLLNPSIELFFSDDGGISWFSADVREFSQEGVYSWRMRWYQLGTSRNRAYKLICVSPVPIVVLGGIRNTRRISGGAY